MHSKITRCRCFAYVSMFTLALCGTAQAFVSPNPLFTDGAVLQREKPVPVWGTADPGEKVTVTIGKQIVSTNAGADGKWAVQLKALATGGPYTLIIAGKANNVTVNDVLVGDVWIAGGQSNMEFPVASNGRPSSGQFGGPPNWQQTIADSTDSQLRFWIVPHTASGTPLTTVKGQWLTANPTTTGALTAVGYFFARDLRHDEKIPIGIIHCNWGGTSAEAWTSRETLTADPDLKALVDARDKQVETYSSRLAAYQAKLPQFQAAYNAAKLKYLQDVAAQSPGAPAPKAPLAPRAPADPLTQPLPTQLYNGMLAPLMPYGIRGAIWYQGETNAGRAYQYETLFPAMIENWRKDWGEGDFAFYFVQLAPYMKISTEPKSSAWAELREAQRLTLDKTKNTAMVVITDVGDQKTIHPLRKEPVGNRLELAARFLEYKENVEYSGPSYRDAKVEPGKITVRFNHSGGLKTGEITDGDGTVLASADTLVGFTIAGEDQVFYPATATISGNTVAVSSPSVPAPVAVRYGWADYPVVNLENSAGLWASPFRTDDWKFITQPAN